jgi:protein-S-isoprenylcysteine O-methyltransferase Ste14
LISTLALWFLFAGYCVIVAFFMIQRLLRRTEGARSFRGGPFDQGNMLLIGSATGIGLSLPLIVDLLGVAMFRINPVEGLVAIAVMTFGLGIRIWAAVTLGRFYTTTLMITEGHKVVTNGPYTKIRHPGYLGDLLIWTGFAVLSSNLIGVLLLPVMFVVVYLYRISVEERMLTKELGEDYVHYRDRTRRLIPFIY